MTERGGKALVFGVMLLTVAALCGVSLDAMLEAADAVAESRVLRQQMQEMAAHDADLRAKLVALSDEYHALYDACAPEINETAWQEIGECTVTHYCGCAVCCGHTGCITATGTLAVMGRTVGVDPAVIPLGSEVLINGVIYIAEDTGVRGKAVDIYIESHEQAEQMGTYSALVCWR